MSEGLYILILGSVSCERRVIIILICAAIRTRRSFKKRPLLNVLWNRTPLSTNKTERLSRCVRLLTEDSQAPPLSRDSLPWRKSNGSRYHSSGNHGRAWYLAKSNIGFCSDPLENKECYGEKASLRTARVGAWIDVFLVSIMDRNSTKVGSEGSIRSCSSDFIIKAKRA